MNLKWSLSTFVFLSISLYPPFIFTTIAPTSIRVVFFLIIVFLLLLKSANFRVIDFFSAGLIVLFCIIGITADTASESVITSLSTALTLAFALSLSRAVRDNVDFRDAFISRYLFLFFLIPSFVILGLLWGLIIKTQINIFSIPIPVGGNLNKFNFFGVLLDKDPLMGFDIYRSFSYFLEPIYLSPFLACNFYLVSEILPNPQKNRFKWLNGIAGICLFSYLFTVIFVFLFIIDRNKNLIKAGFLIINILALLIFGVNNDVSDLIYDFFRRSSLDERLYRMSAFVYLMQNSDAIQIIFGRGYAFKIPYFDMDVSAGILNQVIEVGLVGAAAMFVFVLNIVRRWEILLFYVLISLVITPLKMPFFWVLLIILFIYYKSLGESKAQNQRQG